MFGIARLWLIALAESKQVLKFMAFLLMAFIHLQSNLVIRNTHRCVSRVAEKPSFYACLFCLSCRVMYSLKTTNYQFMRCSGSAGSWSSLRASTRARLHFPTWKMIGKQCLLDLGRERTLWYMNYSFLIINTSLPEMRLKIFIRIPSMLEIINTVFC